MNLRQATPWLAFVLLLAAGGALSAQEDRAPRADDSSDMGHVAESRSEPDPSPPEAPPEVPSAPPDSPSEAPPDDSSPGDSPDSSSGEVPDSSAGAPGRRYAVPVTELPPPHRQPPSRGPHTGPGEPPPPDDGDDGSTVSEEPFLESDDLPLPSGGSSSSGRGYGGRDVLGALDLDLSPGRTQVYVDGQYLGIVDQYDGWPSFLLLEPGIYELVFYLDGFKTLARRVTIYPGTKIEIDDRLEPGPSVRPEDFGR